MIRPTFVAPALAAARWAIVFVAGMVAVPAPHHTWAWLALGPFCIHFWRMLHRLSAKTNHEVRAR